MKESEKFLLVAKVVLWSIPMCIQELVVLFDWKSIRGKNILFVIMYGIVLVFLRFNPD